MGKFGILSLGLFALQAVLVSGQEAVSITMLPKKLLCRQEIVANMSAI